MCNGCNGTGLVTYTDYVPYGSTTVAMETADYCLCTETSCPQCGENTEDTDHWDDEKGRFNPCPFCGWDIEGQYYDKKEDEFDDLVCLDCTDDDCEKCVHWIKFEEKGE